MEGEFHSCREVVSTPPPRGENGDHVESWTSTPQLGSNEISSLSMLGWGQWRPGGESGLPLLPAMFPWYQGSHVGSAKEASLLLLVRKISVQT